MKATEQPRLKTCPRCGGSGVFRAKRVKAKCELCKGRGVYVPEAA